MPRIRKKTSKRGTTHQRSKIKHKVAESRRKAKKESKKNPQWKSKHKKDPGIPNNFPYKDQILAEIAAQRRQEEEAKQLRKEQRKAQKAAANGEDDGEGDESNAFDGITSIGSALAASTQAEKSILTTKGKGKASATTEDDDNVPILVNSEYKNLKTVLDKADVVLHVLDVRDPLAYQSEDLQEYVRKAGKGKTFLVLNKIDTCPRESVQAWAAKLRKKHPTFLFRSASAFLPRNEDQNRTPASKANDVLPTSDAKGLKVLLQTLKNEASKKKADEPLVVAVVGVANTGKSALVNSLLKKPVSTVYKLSSAPPGPSTTERALELTLQNDGKQIVLIDTPALSWERVENTDEDAAIQQRARDMLLRNKGRIDRAKDPITPVTQIASRANTEDLMVFYTLPAFAPGDAAAFLSALARRHNLVKKHGELDLVGAARIALRDWSTGRFPWYTHPHAPSSKAEAEAEAHSVGEVSDEGMKALYEKDEEILDATPLRKEMRRGAGLVKLVPGEVEKRRVALEVPWDEENEDSDDEEEDDEGEGEDGEDAESDERLANISDGDEDEEDEEDEETEENEEEVPLPPKGKRKRQENSVPSTVSKKVAFGPLPKGTKQARAQPSSKKVPAKSSGKKQRR